MKNFPKEYLTELTEIFREYSEIQKILSDPSDKSKLVRKRLSQLVSNINKLHETLIHLVLQSLLCWKKVRLTTELLPLVG
jgi:hypothetical protein